MVKQMIKNPFWYALLTALCLLSNPLMARGNLPDFAQLVRDNGPAVVNISTSKKVNPSDMIPERYRRGAPGADELFDDLMKHFSVARAVKCRSTSIPAPAVPASSCQVMQYVVTNSPCVSGADEIMVKLTTAANSRPS
ncbi:MAG: hypothetical protein R3E95_18945 [Thiolinea sp.]